MLVNKINLQEMTDDIFTYIDKKKKIENNLYHRKNMIEFEKIKQKINKKYLKTSDSNTVIDLVNTISNNNDIIQLKPNSLSDFIIENKKDIQDLLNDKTDLLFDLLSDNSIKKLLKLKKHKILKDFIKNNKKFVYSLIYENNPEKYNEIINFYSTFFSNDISKEKDILPLVEEFFLDDNIPKGWYLCYDKKSGSYYYYNKCLDKSTWENPSYIFWKEKIEIERNKNMETQNKSKKENNESNSLTILLDIDDIK